MEPSYGETMHAPPCRSFFWNGLIERSGSSSPDDYLVEQANLRGFLGAFNAKACSGEMDHTLELEDIVVGLLHPLAPAEHRAVKLVVRMLQSDRIDPVRLWFRARRERADAVLAWVVGLIPAGEHNAAIRALEAIVAAHPPREQRRPAIRYDPARLERVKARLA